MKKKIAFFHPVDDKYGASNILAFIVRILAKDHVCHIYMSKLTGDIESTIASNNNPNIKFIEYSELPLVHRGMYSVGGIYTWILSNLATYKFLKTVKNDYDLIYINTVSLFSIAAISRILGVKNIVHCHEYLSGSIYGRVIKLLVTRFSDEIISVSNHVDSYISNGTSKCKVVKNGIPDLIMESEPNSFYLEPGYMHFSLVGRVMPEKGHWFLLDMLKKLPIDILSKIKIHVFGNSPPTRKYLMEDFRNEIIKLGLEGTVIFYGFDSQAASKIINMNVCLIPSMMADPFPTTVLEAIRAGKIVIATNHGGAKEVIEHGVNGYLIAPGNVEAFCAVVTEIVTQNAEKNKEVGFAARTLFLENYTIEKFQERFKTALKNELY